MKNKMKFSVLLLLCTFCAAGMYAQPDTIVYKQVGETQLKMVVRKPTTAAPGEKYPVFVMFPGGGWKSMQLGAFTGQASHFAKRGMVTVIVQYRTEKQNGTDPRAAVTDAKSAIRYIRSHSSELGIDPDRIVAGGGSAGGHLAAATAYITSFDDPTDDISVSAAPSTLVLWNPVIDNSEQGYGYPRVSQYWREFSPMHNITPERAVPTLIMSGQKDALIKPATLTEYQEKTRAAGALCRLVIYENAAHGFFNPSKQSDNGRNYYKETLAEADRFLVSQKYLAPIKKQPQKRDR